MAKELDVLRAELIIAQKQLRTIRRKVELLEDQIDSKGGEKNH